MNIIGHLPFVSRNGCSRDTGECERTVNRRPQDCSIGCFRLSNVLRCPRFLKSWCTVCSAAVDRSNNESIHLPTLAMY